MVDDVLLIVFYAHPHIDAQHTGDRQTDRRTHTHPLTHSDTHTHTHACMHAHTQTSNDKIVNLIGNFIYCIRKIMSKWLDI